MDTFHWHKLRFIDLALKYRNEHLLSIHAASNAPTFWAFDLTSKNYFWDFLAL